MIDLIAHLKAHGTKYSTGSIGAFLPESMFRSCADLDGKTAAAFLASNGYTVIGYANLGNNGLANTKEGLKLSTNGHLSYEGEAA